jgi:hypothetical protein
MESTGIGLFYIHLTWRPYHSSKYISTSHIYATTCTSNCYNSHKRHDQLGQLYFRSLLNLEPSTPLFLPYRPIPSSLTTLLQTPITTPLIPANGILHLGGFKKKNRHLNWKKY